jgi:cyclase
MTLKVRIIPTLLWKDFGLVKGVGFDSWRRVGPIVPAVRVYTARDVDELAVVDITATQQGRGPDLDLVAEVAAHASVPLSYGGGITTVEQVARVLEAGAEKVIVNTALYDDIELAERSAQRFGVQSVVASIDFRRTPDGVRCYSRSGTAETGREPVEWARIVESAGAGEILLTAADRDGTMSGFDLAVTQAVTEAVGIPVIASGGAASSDDMLAAVQVAGASAVAAASLFHFTELTPQQVKNRLAAAGVPVRGSRVGAPM